MGLNSMILHIPEPKRRPRYRPRSLRWILILASFQLGVVLGSWLAMQPLESEARLIQRAQEVLR